MDASPQGQVVFREVGRGQEEAEQSKAQGIFGDQTVNPLPEGPWGNCKEIRKAGNGSHCGLRTECERLKDRKRAKLSRR